MFFIVFLSYRSLLEVHWIKNCSLNPVRVQITWLINLSVIGPLNLGHLPHPKCTMIGLNLALPFMAQLVNLQKIILGFSIWCIYHCSVVLKKKTNYFPIGYNDIAFIFCECYQQMKRVYHFDAVTWQGKVLWSKAHGRNVTLISCKHLISLSEVT